MFLLHLSFRISQRYNFMGNNSNSQSEIIVSSPGRINLIGGHTDYNKGFVLPAAIDKNILLRFKKNGSDNQCTVHSQGYAHPLHIDLKHIKKSNEIWENYVLGVIQQIQQAGKTIHGFDCAIESNLPIGSGLSSSAALECGVATGLNQLFDLNFSKSEIVALSMKAEHEFVGTKCGIMDQFSSVNGRKDHVMLLDCLSLDYQYISANLNPYSLLLLNTNVSHQLSDGQYNSRQQDCFGAIATIKKSFPEVNFLRDVDEAMLIKCKADLHPDHYKRSLFIVQENQRVLAAVEALKSNDIKELGKLIYDCHEGLRHQYDISCPELDFLVDYSKEKEFVIGSRVMGGGFGGCTLNLVHKDHMDSYIEETSQAYNKAFGINLGAFCVNLSNGTTVKENNINEPI